MALSENDEKWKVLQVKLQEHNACKAFRAFWGAGFEPILIKGYAAARNYPNGVGRASVDVDLCFAPEEFDPAKEFVAANPVKGVLIDFHEGFRHLDSLSWEALFSRSEIIDLEEGKIRVLSAEDHLRVLCTHWLTDGGENQERLWDIYYSVENRGEAFDWDKCINVVSENRQDWVIYTIGLAHHFLDLDISGLPFEDKAKKVPSWLKYEVKKHWDIGVPIAPLNTTFNDREQFWKQLKKRFPPNPIFSTISMEGKLDAKTRLHYQVGNFFQRFLPTWKTHFKNYFRTRKR